MTSPLPTPAGWYTGDVPGEERWWGGAAWTAYARPTAQATLPTGPQPSTFWSGSKNGSLVAAILCGVCVLPTFLITVFTTLTAGLMGFMPGVAFLALTTYAILGFLNWNGLRKNELIRAQQQAGAPQIVTRPPQL